MEETTCHEMVIYLSQILSNMLCFFNFYLPFVISLKYDFRVDAKGMIVETR